MTTAACDGRSEEDATLAPVAAEVEKYADPFIQALNGGGGLLDREWLHARKLAWVDGLWIEKKHVFVGEGRADHRALAAAVSCGVLQFL